MAGKANAKVTKAPHNGALVTVVANEKAIFMKTGKEYEISSTLADRLIKQKKVSLK